MPDLLFVESHMDTLYLADLYVVASNVSMLVTAEPVIVAVPSMLVMCVNEGAATVAQPRFTAFYICAKVYSDSFRNNFTCKNGCRS